MIFANHETTGFTHALGNAHQIKVYKLYKLYNFMNYNGIFPCFFGGLVLLLFCVSSSAWMSFFRVSLG